MLPLDKQKIRVYRKSDSLSSVPLCPGLSLSHGFSFFFVAISSAFLFSLLKHFTLEIAVTVISTSDKFINLMRKKWEKRLLFCCRTALGFMFAACSPALGYLNKCFITENEQLKDVHNASNILRHNFYVNWASLNTFWLRDQITRHCRSHSLSWFSISHLAVVEFYIELDGDKYT